MTGVGVRGHPDIQIEPDTHKAVSTADHVPVSRMINGKTSPTGLCTLVGGLNSPARAWYRVFGGGACRDAGPYYFLPVCHV